MHVEIPYGQDKIGFEVPDKNFITMMDPEFVEPVRDIAGAILNAINNPFGSKKIEDIVSPGKKSPS